MIDRLLEGKRIAICAGPGGVGKTTTAAALAAGMAMRGAKVAVVTIDPARRLADALGLDALGDEPQRVDPARFGGEMAGELWAMMLDPKRTFDGLIDHVAPTPQARQEVLDNRIYQQLSSAIAGTQEFTAIAKLYDLDQAGGFDLLVLDTPPSRNALDFLDAPDRLTGFFQGRAISMFLPAAGIGGRVLGAGSGLVFGALKRATGVALIDDLQTFFRALAGMIPELVERGRHVKELLDSPRTALFVVTSLERDPIDEAIFFHARVREQGLPFGAVIVNKVRPAVADFSEDELIAELGADLGHRVALTAREAQGLAARDAANLERLRRELGDPTVVAVPQVAGDVHDLDGLAHVGEALFSQA